MIVVKDLNENFEVNNSIIEYYKNISKNINIESLLNNRKIRAFAKENSEFRALIENGHLKNYVQTALDNNEELSNSKTLRKRGIGPGFRLEIDKHINNVLD